MIEVWCEDKRISADDSANECENDGGWEMQNKSKVLNFVRTKSVPCQCVFVSHYRLHTELSIVNAQKNSASANLFAVPCELPRICTGHRSVYELTRGGGVYRLKYKCVVRSVTLQSSWCVSRCVCVWKGPFKNVFHLRVLSSKYFPSEHTRSRPLRAFHAIWKSIFCLGERDTQTHRYGCPSTHTQHTHTNSWFLSLWGTLHRFTFISLSLTLTLTITNISLTQTIPNSNPKLYDGL